MNDRAVGVGVGRQKESRTELRRVQAELSQSLTQLAANGNEERGRGEGKSLFLQSQFIGSFCLAREFVFMLRLLCSSASAFSRQSIQH